MIRTSSAGIAVSAAVSLFLFLGSAFGDEIQYDPAKIEAKKPKEMANPPSEGDPFYEAGRRVYFKRCYFCHGRHGRGDGVAAPYLDPRPRDFTFGMFKFRSTKSGELPTDADLFRTVSRGVPGTAMPAWGEGVFTLSETERWQAIYFLKSFTEDFQNEDLNPYEEDRTFGIGVPPKATPERVENGRKWFMDIDKAACVNCHGELGRGSGTEAGNHTDDWGDLILPADLTKPWKYKSGSTIADIYRTLTGGMNGTPMPSFVDALQSDDDRWDLAIYVFSLQESLSPDDDILEAEKVEGDLPKTVDDPAWGKAESIDVITGGQVVLGPRWQNPAVDVVRMKALYNSEEIALLFTWNDRFENTESEGTPFDITEPKNGVNTLTPDEPVVTRNDRIYEWEEIKALGDLWNPVDTYLKVDAAKIRAAAGNLPDQLAIHFPVKLPPPGRLKRPYLFMGDHSHRINGWNWIAGNDRVVDTNAEGPQSGYTPQKDGEVVPTATSVFHEGQWKLVLTRKIASDEKNDITFVRGQFIPFTLRVWDGANGEVGLQSAISSWYVLNLKSSTPRVAYLYGFLGVFVTLALEFALVNKVRKNGSKQDG